MDKVYIVIVNYNGWQDTIEALESVYRTAYGHFQVVVVDNCSIDSSIERITAWAHGALSVWTGESSLRRFIHPPVDKPVPCVQYGRAEAEQGGRAEEEARACRKRSTLSPLVVIRAGENLGFAGGNNIGIRYAFQRGDCRYLWLLNNDTVVEPNSLAMLVACCKRRSEGRGEVGIVGSKLLFYHAPRVVQSMGARYFPWIGKVRHLDAGQEDDARVEEMWDDTISYASGASLLIDARCLSDVGLLSEEYFLYFEEIDLAQRARQNNWRFCVTSASRVYHKEGATIQGNSPFRGAVGDYHYLRSRIVYTKKFHKKYLFFMYLGLLVAVLNRIRRGQYGHIRIVWDVLLDTLREIPARQRRYRP